MLRHLGHQRLLETWFESVSLEQQGIDFARQIAEEALYESDNEKLNQVMSTILPHIFVACVFANAEVETSFLRPRFPERLLRVWL